MRRHYSKKKNSIKIFAVVALVAALIVFISTYLFSTKSEMVVAKINNHKIYKSELETKLRSIFESQNFGKESLEIPEISALPKEVIEVLAKEVYLEKELTKQAAKSSAAKSKEIKSKILASKDRILRQAYIDSVIKEKVNDDTIRAKYNELNDSIKGKKEYSISHIVTKTKEEADKIVKELNAKKAPKFADLAKKYSIDQDSAKSGGSLGFIVQDNMFKEISDVLVTLKKDQISQPVQTKFGWHVIKFSDVREAQSLPFESVKDNIREQLLQETINEINSGIIKDAKVEVLIKVKEPKTSEETKTTNSSSENNVEKVAAPEASEEILSIDEKSGEESKEESQPAKTEEKKSHKHEAKHKKEAKHKDKK